MVEKTVVRVVKKYLQAVSNHGIPVKAGVVFGSSATGKMNKWSDIDLLVVSARFDKKFKRSDIDMLWHIAADIDNRIEPIAVGERQFEEETASGILDVARREGQIIPLAD